MTGLSSYTLPEQFVTSVKVLFDVLDSTKTGYIWLKDLESKWNSENTGQLSVGVIEALRAVAPPNGRLDFQLFLLGLRNSLEQSSKRQSLSNGAEHEPPVKPIKPFSLQNRSQSSPFIQVQSSRQYNLPQRKIPSLSQENLTSIQTAQYAQQSDDTNHGYGSQLSPRSAAQHKQESEYYRRQAPRRRDSTRRHTLGHGVDDSMLRRSRLLEEERRMLLRGLQSVDKARHWFGRRLTEVSDKQRFGATDTTEQNTEQQLERINFESLRISELAQQIDALTEPTAQGGLMRMNLARSAAQPRQQTIPYELNSGQQPQQDSQHAMQLIRAQNKMLTKEVSQKAERVALLEKEKATLLKDLFESRANQRVQQRKVSSNGESQSHNGGGRAVYEESTFM